MLIRTSDVAKKLNISLSKARGLIKKGAFGDYAIECGGFPGRPGYLVSSDAVDSYEYELEGKKDEKNAKSRN